MADIEPMPHGPVPSRAAQVRQNALYAFVAGALMLYFGYPPGGWNVSPDDPRSLRYALWVFDYTLVVGGVLMGLTALLLFSGWIYALGLDAIACGSIGLLLIACGMAIAINDYREGYLYLIFGVMFGASSRHAWAEFRALRATAIVSPPEVQER